MSVAVFDVKRALRLCLVIGPSNVKGSWLAVVERAVAGGVTMVQLREKNATPQCMMQYAGSLLRILPQGIPLIVNDCVATAKALNLGLHIGQQDCAYDEARCILGDSACIGLSIENREQAMHYKECGANYFGVGPVFATPSKADAAPLLGAKQACGIAGLLQPTPAVFIGGVSSANMLQLKSFGGIAVISAITASDDPQRAAQALRGDL